MGAVNTPTETVVIGVTAVVAWAVMEMTRYTRGGQSLQCWNSTASPAHRAGNGNGNGSMDSGDLNHGHAVGAEDLRLASLCPVNRGVGVGVVGDMGRGAVGGGNEIGHTVPFALFAGGTLVDSIKKHVVASYNGWWSTEL